MSITVILRFKNEKHSVPTEDTIILEDLLQQWAERNSATVPQNQNWIVSKEKGATNEALDLGASLQDNGVVDGDILDLALPTSAGVC